MGKGFAISAVADNACSKSSLTKNMRQRSFSYVLMITACILMAACMPLKDENINAELFKDKEEMKVRTAELQQGMSKSAAFEVLNVPMERFSAMSTPEVQTAVYGNSMVQGSPTELERFRKRLLGYEGYSLPYRQIESTGSLGFAKMKVDKTGHDLRLVMIFDQGKLMTANVVGEEEYKATEQAVIKRCRSRILKH